MKILIAAAGTGGHINPGIAIANKIKEKNPNAEIVFVGTNRGLENDLVPRAGYKLEKIEVYGFSKQISLDNMKKIIKTIKGFSQAKKLIKEFKPDIVIGTGGYICGPIGMAAVESKIPTVLHESNAFPGKTIKILSKKVDKILLGFEDAKKRLPKAKKLIVTGTPTKFTGLELSEEEIINKKKELGFNSELPLVLVFGGSQGAKVINETIINIIKEKLNLNYQILWASGPKQYDIIKEELEDQKININNIKNVKIFPYIYNMEEVMKISDLVVCRSGAMTITEIAISKKPAIFIPLSTAAENHQEYNANVLVNINSARILHDNELNEKTLNNMINELISNRDDLKKMGENAEKIVTKNVEDKIYSELEEYIKKVQ